jgi:hypothetical protein
MLNLRPISSDREDPVAGDEALLEQAVEAALMETAADMKDPDAVRAAAAPDAAETFLQRAANFLNTRTDRAELLERLRALVSIPSSEPQPGQPAALDTSERKPE